MMAPHAKGIPRKGMRIQLRKRKVIKVKYYDDSGNSVRRVKAHHKNLPKYI